MLNITNGPSSALAAPALPAGCRRSSALCASDRATSTVILIPRSGRSLPAAGRDLSRLLGFTSAFLCALCVKSFAFLCAACLQKHQFLFDTNKPFAFILNFSTQRKQSTSFFLFDTNERSPIIAEKRSNCHSEGGFCPRNLLFPLHTYEKQIPLCVSRPPNGGGQEKARDSVRDDARSIFCLQMLQPSPGAKHQGRVVNEHI
jgi:hypothetical protein